MSVLDGPGEGTWSVFAQKVVEERDAAREEVERLRKDHERSTDWYQQRFNRLRRWVKEEVEPLSEDVARRYFAICANGSPSPHESADWQETMHGLKLERDAALERVSQLERAVVDAALVQADFLEKRDAARHEVARLLLQIERLRHVLTDIREWAQRDHVMRFDDGAISLANYCTQAIQGEK